MALMSVLLKLARKVLEQVLNEVNRQIQRLENEVLEQMQRLVTQGFDEVWRGEDADQFREKVTNAAMNATREVIGDNRNTVTGLGQASDIVTRADQRVAQLVGELESTFGRVF